MKVTFTIDVTYPDDQWDAEAREEVLEDLEDVARGFGGYGVVIGVAEADL